MRLLKYAICLICIVFPFLGIAQDTLGKITLPTQKPTIEILEARIQLLEKQVDDDKEQSLLENMQLGLSFGFNYFFNGEEHYYVKQDSTIGSYGKKQGVSGMLSALVGYKLNSKHSVLLNVPLGDLSSSPNQAIGVFNKKVAGGLGYGYNVSDLSFILVVNIFPYDKLALEIVQDKKFEQEPYTVAKLEDMPTTTAYSPSITIGVCYNFLKSGVLGY